MSERQRGGERIARAFARARDEERAALLAYIVAGDPDVATTHAIIDALATEGADLIELGIPYGDPLADGPTIAAAAHRALAAGMTTAGALAVVAAAAQRHATPIVLFTYANPVVQFGIERFARAAAQAGAAGAIIPDLPLEETSTVREAFAREGLVLPLLVSPTTPRDRAVRITAASEGFVYVVARLGVTGARREPDVAWIAGRVEELRTGTQLPLAAGFGISSAQHVAALAPLVEGIVIGSAIVDAAAGTGAGAADAVRTYLRGIVPSLGRKGHSR